MSKYTSAIIFKKLQHIKTKYKVPFILTDVMLIMVALSITMFISVGALDRDISNINWIYLPISTLAFITSVLFTNLYKIRPVNKIFDYLTSIIFTSFFVSFILGAVALVESSIGFSLIVYAVFINTIFTLFFLSITRVLFVVFYYYVISKEQTISNYCFVFGTDAISSMYIKKINSDIQSPYYVMGILTSNTYDHGKFIHGRKIESINKNEEELSKMFSRCDNNTIIFPTKECFLAINDQFKRYCLSINVRMLIGENLENIKDENFFNNNLRPVTLSDLLEIDNINIDSIEINKELKGKTVLITGAAGLIGSSIAYQLLKSHASKLILVDHSDKNLHFLKIDLEKQHQDIDIEYILGDIQSESKMDIIFYEYRPHFVFHAAAYVHVDIVEKNPCETVLTNVWGTINIAKNANKYSVEKFVYISSDKAINPTEYYGVTKYIADCYIQKINKQSNTEFTSIRFGHVLGKKSSFIAALEKQIAIKGSFYAPHPDTVRCTMTDSEISKLILNTLILKKQEGFLNVDMGDKVSIQFIIETIIKLAGLEINKDIRLTYSDVIPDTKIDEARIVSKDRMSETEHSRIFVSKLDFHDEDELLSKIDSLIESARSSDAKSVVIKFKEIIPEFINI